LDYSTALPVVISSQSEDWTLNLIEGFETISVWQRNIVNF